MPTVTIEVTAEDIREGQPCKLFDCPYARAVARAFPGLRAEVRPGKTCLLHQERVVYEFPNPPAVMHWINRLDAAFVNKVPDQAEPFRVELELAPGVLASLRAYAAGSPTPPAG